MASVGEVKAILAQASRQAGEAWQALETAKEQAGAALAVTQEAVSSAASAYDGSGHEVALTALSQFHRAEAEIRAVYSKIDSEAQDALLVAQNACDLFMGQLG